MVLTLDHLLDDFILDNGDRINQSCLRLFWYAFSLPGGREDVDVSDFSDWHCRRWGGLLFADDVRRVGAPVSSSSADHTVSSCERSTFLTVPDIAAPALSMELELIFLLLRSEPSLIDECSGFLLDSALMSNVDIQPGSSLCLKSRASRSMWDSASSLALGILGTLVERLPRELVMLATLSFRIIVVAELRTRCSLLDRVVMPGNGKTLRLHTSASKASRRARSPREGASTGVREFVVNSDCERLIGRLDVDVDVSFRLVVFFSMT